MLTLSSGLAALRIAGRIDHLQQSQAIAREFYSGIAVDAADNDFAIGVKVKAQSQIPHNELIGTFIVVNDLMLRWHLFPPRPYRGCGLMSGKYFCRHSAQIPWDVPVLRSSSLRINFSHQAHTTCDIPPLAYLVIYCYTNHNKPNCQETHPE